MSLRAARAIVWAVAAFYAYGALVHMMNIAGLSGFDWGSAPRKWQILDIAYLAVDIVVVVALPRWRPVGFVALYAAAASQIVLYTLLRPWVIAVPASFAPTAEQVAYLDGLVIFHVVTIVLVTVALILRRGAGVSGTTAE